MMKQSFEDFIISVVILKRSLNSGAKVQGTKDSRRLKRQRFIAFKL